MGSIEQCVNLELPEGREPGADERGRETEGQREGRKGRRGRDRNRDGGGISV